MARTARRPAPDREQVLKTLHHRCLGCGGRLRYRYDNRHTVTTLTGLVRLRLQIRRCENPGCTRCRMPYRPEAEGAIVLPQHEFGLDHFEGRSWIGLHRHALMTMVAFAFLQHLRLEQAGRRGKKLGRQSWLAVDLPRGV